MIHMHYLWWCPHLVDVYYRRYSRYDAILFDAFADPSNLSDYYMTTPFSRTHCLLRVPWLQPLSTVKSLYQCYYLLQELV